MADPQIGMEQFEDYSSKTEMALKIFIALFVIAVGFILIGFSDAFTVPGKMGWSEPMVQLGLSLIIAGIGYLTFQYTFERGNKQYTGILVRSSVDQIQKTVKEVDESLKRILSQNQILNGAYEKGLVQIFPDRVHGLADIMTEMKSSNKIMMMGISLKDYFNTGGKYYVEMEKLINDIKGNERKELRVLIINPFCEQATIRAERESNNEFSDANPYTDSGLWSDVWETIRYLHELEKAPPASDSRGKVFAKVYSSAPSSFLVITDRYVFIEQYHYGLKKSGLVGGTFPLLKFPNSRSLSANISEASVSDNLIGHFEYVWDEHNKRSLPLVELLENKMIGISISAWESRLMNVFTTRENARERIAFLLRNENSSIKLIGISLRDFLHAGKNYYDILQQKSKKVSVQCLLLDPQSEQGELRSKREEPNVKTGNLYSEVQTSIRSIQRLNEEKCKITAKLYAASPSCFAIITERSVVIEQYHYGSSKPGATIAGGKVPVFEFAKNSSTYEELVGHFDFIWSLESSKEVKQSTLET